MLRKFQFLLVLICSFFFLLSFSHKKKSKLAPLYNKKWTCVPSEKYLTTLNKEFYWKIISLEFRKNKTCEIITFKDTTTVKWRFDKKTGSIKIKHKIINQENFILKITDLSATNFSFTSYELGSKTYNFKPLNSFQKIPLGKYNALFLQSDSAEEYIEAYGVEKFTTNEKSLYVEFDSQDEDCPIWIENNEFKIANDTLTYQTKKIQDRDFCSEEFTESIMTKEDSIPFHYRIISSGDTYFTGIQCEEYGCIKALWKLVSK